MIYTDKNIPIPNSKALITDQNMNLQQQQVNRCDLCLKNSPKILQKKSESILYDKYFEAFNFYFAKPINEILANITASHVVLFKDYLYYDDIREFLKRGYTTDESSIRIKNLSEFYIKAGSNPKPNLSIHEQNKFIQKRNIKIHKLFVAKLQNYNDMPKTHREKDEGQNNNPIEFKILSSNLNDEESMKDSNPFINISSRGRYGAGTAHEGSFKIMLDKYEKNMMKISYESKEHDIYNPSFSSDNTLAIDDDKIEITPTKNSMLPEIENIMLGQNPDINKIFADIDKSLSASNEGDKLELSSYKNQRLFSESHQRDTSEIMLINEIINPEGLALNTKIAQLQPPLSLQQQQQQPISGLNSNHILDIEKKIERESTDTRAQLINEFKNKKLLGLEHLGERCQTEQYASSRLETQKNDFFDLSSDKFSHSPHLETKSSRFTMQNPKIMLDHRFDQIKKASNFQNQPYDQINELLPYALQSNSSHSQSVGSNNKATPNSKGSNYNGMPKSNGANTNNTIQKIYDNFVSLQQTKEVVQKYQKYSDDAFNLRSKYQLDEFKRTSPVQNKMNFCEKPEEKQRKIKEVYNTVGNENEKVGKPKKISQLSRSKTEIGLSQKLGLNKLKKEPISPLRPIQENGFDQNLRHGSSPFNNRKTKQYFRVLSNEGLSTNITGTMSGCPMMITNTDESLKSSSTLADKKFKNRKKTESLISNDKHEIKPPLNGHFNRNINTTPQPQNFQSSQYLGNNKSVPLSPNQKVDLKINLAKLNHANAPKMIQHTEEANENNSYGFWTSRSSRGATEEFPRQKKSTEPSNDYFLKNQYGLAENRKKDKIPNEKGSRSLTKFNSNFELKVKDISTKSNKNTLGSAKALGTGNQYFADKKIPQGVLTENSTVHMNNLNMLNKKLIRK